MEPADPMTARLTVHYARERVAEMILEAEFDYVWWLDDDMVFPPDTLTRLLKHQKQVVCALAYQRAEPYNTCVFEWKEETHLPGRYEYLNGIEFGGLRKVDGCGSACVLTETSVFKKLLKKRPWFDNKKFGEDLHFCKLCNEASIPIYCDTDLVIGHLGGRLVVDYDVVARYRHAKAERDALLACVR